MIRISRLFAWVIIASGWPLAAQGPSTVQADNSQPTDIRIDHDVQVENWRVLDIFQYILRGTAIHGGFVEIADCSILPKGRLHIGTGLTIRQAMDALVAANPGYKWELRDGVVNMVPISGAPLLNTRISRFEMAATEMQIPAVVEDVLRLPEVRERETAIGVKEGPGQGGLSSGEVHPIPRQPVPVHVDLENLLLQDAFNKIVRVSPKWIWIYHENSCNGAKTFIVEVASDY